MHHPHWPPRTQQNSLITMASLKKKVGDFQLGHTIGSGTFGKVKEGLHLPTGKKVAIKVLEKARIASRDDLSRVQQQLTILQKVDHPNILKLLELHQTPTNLYIVTELVEGVELYQVIVESQKLSAAECGSYFYQLVSAVRYLHEKGICHRDIKPENIIIDSKGHLKLIDFGLSKQLGPSGLLQTSCGSPCYAAPEMLHGRKYDACKVDIWALGVTLHAMAAGHLPYEEENTQRLYRIIERDAFKCSENIPVGIRNLIESMMQKQAAKRPDIHKVWEDSWVVGSRVLVPTQEYECDDLILNSMSKFFSRSVSAIRKIITTKEIPSICTYYFLARRLKAQPHHKSQLGKDSLLSIYRDDDCRQLIKQMKGSSQVEYEIHEGAFHVSFCFSSHKEVCEFAARLKGASVVSETELDVRGVQVKVKKIKGTELLYAEFPPYFNGIEQM